MTTVESSDQLPGRALVTGATSGLGRVIARRLAGDRFDVVVHGRDPGRGAAAVADIEAEGGRARFIGADLTDSADLRRLAETAGPVDVLVNNAGFSAFGPTAHLEPDRFDALFASNVRAPYFLVAALGPSMAARGRGSIVNISSMGGTVGLASAAAYGATKAALDAMTRAWTAEFSPRGVRVNSVAPGPVYTDGAAPERTTALGATTPLGRAARADEIAEVVAFLASERSSYMTGAVIAVDGGRTAIYSTARRPTQADALSRRPAVVIWAGHGQTFSIGTAGPRGSRRPTARPARSGWRPGRRPEGGGQGPRRWPCLGPASRCPGTSRRRRGHGRPRRSSDVRCPRCPRAGGPRRRRSGSPGLDAPSRAGARQAEAPFRTLIPGAGGRKPTPA